MKSNFEYCLKQVLKSEGGYTNDPQDPGGPTNFGITIHDYRAYINHEGTAEDVRGMNVEQAGAIYKAKYWDVVNGDYLPSGVDYCTFDYGVNSGVSRANHILRMVEQKTTDPNKIIDQICDERLRFLKGLKTWYHFGLGWSRRVASVRRNSHILAHEDTSTKPPIKDTPCNTIPTMNWMQRLLLSCKIYFALWTSKA